MVFCVFKQKTAYDMRISDWSSDVCSSDLKLRQGQDDAMLALCEKYYDHGLYLRLIEHAGEAEQKDLKLGYADCALPLILEHTTPNNSIPLLWAEHDRGDNGPAMCPLFRRGHRQRSSMSTPFLPPPSHHTRH